MSIIIIIIIVKERKHPRQRDSYVRSAGGGTASLKPPYILQ